ncbi:MFS transporter [Methanosarcina sp.]|uniref:MFS transporter n=1 Tax=Methanosarcina sp. TaxID=2213 RepID=UPI002B59E9E2|nr:MFS transporter [Methanosarcina sp.]HOW14653.1 MFS transporter [Methanosarcina sp.]
MHPERRLIYVAVFAIMGLSNAVIPILPELAAHYHSTYGEFASSLLFSGYFLGALATMLPFGILSDRLGNLRLIGLGVTFTVISGLIIFFSGNLWILIISRFIEGAACGAFFPAAYSTLSRCKDPGRCLGEFTFFTNAALGAGALFSGILADIFLKGAVLIFTFTALLSGIPLLYRLRELINPKKGENNDLGPDSLKTHFKHSFREVAGLISRRNLEIWLSSFLLNGAVGVLIAYYPDYSLGILSKVQLGSAIASLYVCAMITSLLIGHFSVNEKTVIRIGLGFSVLGAFFAVKYPFLGFSSLGGGSGIAMVGFALAVAGMDADRGLSMGLFNTTIYAGLSLLPIAAGLLAEVLSLEKLFLANGFILAGTLLLKD